MLAQAAHRLSRLGHSYEWGLRDIWAGSITRCSADVFELSSSRADDGLDNG